MFLHDDKTKMRWEDNIGFTNVGGILDITKAV